MKHISTQRAIIGYQDWNIYRRLFINTKSPLRRRYRSFTYKLGILWNHNSQHTILTFIFTYLLTPRSTVLLEQLTGFQLVKKFPAFHGTQRFITTFTSTLHLSLSWASSIQSIPPHPTSWRSILILSFHLRLRLPSGLFPLGFPTQNPAYVSLLPIRATCPAHFIILDYITRIILGE